MIFIAAAIYTLPIAFFAIVGAMLVNEWININYEEE